MIGVLGTCRPARIDKRVMEILLDIVDNPLLEIRWTFAQHSQSGSGLDHECLVTGSKGFDEIMLKEANDAVSVSLRDSAAGFSTLSHFLARRAVRHPVPNHKVTRTEQIRTDDARSPEIVERPERLSAREAGNRAITPPHGSFPDPEGH